jgi:tetratricopeptide (TPR) repeat protein
VSDARAKEVTRLLKRGLNHYALGDVKAAIASWEEARTLDPENQALHDYLEAAYDEVEAEPSTEVSQQSFEPVDLDDATPVSEIDERPRTSKTPPTPRSEAAKPAPKPAKPVKAPPPPDADDPDTQISRALTAYKSGQLREALKDLQKVADGDPERLDVQGYMQLVRSELAKTSAQEIGDKGRVVSLQIPTEKLMKLRLAPDEGFLLSQVDGTLSIADLIALSSADRVRTLDIIARFLREGIIA